MGSGYQAGAPWPAPGGCPARRSRAKSVGPESAKLGWCRNLALGSVGDPSIASDGTIYVATTNPSQVWALDSVEGNVKWTFALHGDAASSIVIGGDGTLYFGSNHRRLYAVAPSGIELWTHTTPKGVNGDTFVTSPVIGADGTLYFGASDKKLHALASDGTHLFSFASGATSFDAGIAGPPAIAPNGTIVFGMRGTEGGGVIAVDADGTLAWKLPIRGVLSSPSIADDGTIYAGAQDGKLYAIDPQGRVLWSFTTRGRVYGPAAIASDGTIIFGGEDEMLYAIDRSGALKWSIVVDGAITRAPAIDGEGTVYLGTQKQTVYAVRADGTPLWMHRFAHARGDRCAAAISHDNKLVVNGALDFRYSAIITFDP